MRSASRPSPVLSLFAGHSGGHLFPALAFAEAFKKQHPQSRLGLVSSIKAKAFTAKMPKDIFDDVYYLPEFPSPSGLSLESLKFLVQLIRAFFLSWRYLSRFKPDLCIGFGSYAAYPGLLLAAAKRMPTLIHEQNVVPGKATAWLMPHVDCLALTFEKTRINKKVNRTIVTGLPIRAQLREIAARAWEVRRDRVNQAGRQKLNLLIVGGSQGAKGLNQLILNAISQFSSEEKEKLAVIHITGQTDFERVREEYQKMKFSAETYPFSEKMSDLYQNADLAVTRAGANTLFELALFGTPAFVIPYPHAGAHQAENAVQFYQQKAIRFSLEKDLSGEKLAAEIRVLMNNPEKLNQLSQTIHSLSNPSAAERLAELTEELLLL